MENFISHNPNGRSVKFNKLLLGASSHMAARRWALQWVWMLTLLLANGGTLGELLKSLWASFFLAEKWGYYLLGSAELILFNLII